MDVPSSNYHLMSLRVVADNVHTYSENQEAASVFSSTGEILFSRFLKDDVVPILARHVR